MKLQTFLITSMIFLANGQELGAQSPPVDFPPGQASIDEQVGERLGCSVYYPTIHNIQLTNDVDRLAEIQNLLTSLLEKISPGDIAPGVEPNDCFQVQQKFNKSGVFTIKPTEMNEGFKVYCDLETDEGGWTVIQRRLDGSVNFNRGWVDYQNGFGSLFTEYWLGNEKLTWLTAQKSYELRIELEDFTGVNKYAKYDHFRVGDVGTRYKLLLGEYKGNAGDSLANHNQDYFTTPDYDNDDTGKGNCGSHFMSGWWFNDCYHANLNGIYRHDGEELSDRGIVWADFRGLNISMKAAEMKIRPLG